MPRPFLKTQFRVKLAERPDADHWSGGQPRHRDARCPTCKIPLLLLWDINCKDPRFPRGKFGPLERLPLYYCWGCVNDLSYQATDDGQLRIHSRPTGVGPSFPYEPYPRRFERRGLVLVQGLPADIPRLYEEMIARWDSDAEDFPDPTPREQKLLTEFFGHSVLWPLCFFHHQLGGKPLEHHWAATSFRCPNPSCRGAFTDRISGRKRAMKFLAGVLNDPWAGLPMAEPATAQTKGDWNYYVTVQYHICDSCWTVLGCNRSD